MLNMAPDKAADETISFQCYPLPVALLYTGRLALTAVLSFFLSLSLSLDILSSLFLFPFFLLPLRLRSLFLLLLLFLSLPKATSLIVLPLSFIFIPFSFLLDIPVHVQPKTTMKVEIANF